MLPGQSWSAVYSFGGAASESLDRLVVQADGSVVFAGSFQAGLSWQGSPLPNQGSSDLLLARMLPDGQPDWALYGGSASTDETTALARDAEGNLFWAGVFWEEGEWSSGFTLSTPTGGRTLFVLRVSPEGLPNWGLAIGGTGPRGINAVMPDSEGRIWISGYFEGNLFLPGQTLQAQGTRDLFVACLHPDTGLEWAIQGGGFGRAEASTLSLRSDGSAAIGGYFDGILVLEGSSIQAETFDEDGFLLLVDRDGQLLWLRKIGAQYDERVIQVAELSNGNLVAAGTFLGVLKAGDLSVSTPGFNTNAFLSAWSPDGEALWLRSIGQQPNERSLALSPLGNGLVFSILYGQSLQADGQQLPGTSTGLSSALIGFGSNGTASWAAGIPADNLLQLSTIGIGPQQEIWTGGSYLGTITPPGQGSYSSGQFDMVLAQVSDAIVSTGQRPPTPAWRLFPNPASERIWVNADAPLQAQLSDSQGRVLWRGIFPAEGLSVHHYPAGLYWLSLWQPGGVPQTMPVVIQPR
jgi:hypothetical protein